METSLVWWVHPLAAVSLARAILHHAQDDPSAVADFQVLLSTHTRTQTVGDSHP